MHGHDHCMSHMQEPGSTINHILTGMGDTCCYKGRRVDVCLPYKSLPVITELSYLTHFNIPDQKFRAFQYLLFYSMLNLQFQHSPSTASNKESIPADSLKFYLAKDNHGSLIRGTEISAGFTSFEASKTNLIVKYYDQHGTLLFTADAIPARKQSS